MAAFEYEALDGNGAVKAGIITADTARLARRELRQSKLVALKLNPVATAKPGAGSLRGTAVNSATLMMMTRQLATMVSAAAPLEEAVHTIAMQSDHKGLQATLLAVRGNIMEGFRLSDALAQHPRVFPSLYCALVAAGELSGNLGAVLERLADHLERAQRMRAKVLAALIYPLALAGVAVLVIGILMTFVVPKVIEQFESLDQQLPLLTRILIGISQGFTTYALPGVIVIAAAIAGFVVALRKLHFRRKVDAVLLRLPILGKLLRGLHAARLCRTLSTLVASGSPVVEGLVAAKRTIRNLVLQDAVSRMVTAIHEGSSLSNALRRADLLPPMVTYMSAVGENTGKLDVMLSKAADHLEGEFESVTGTALSLLEPAIIVVMGAIVAMIVLAILMPILQLNSLALM